MLVTAHFYTNKTVVLNTGAHSFITRESNINYGSADFIPLSRLNSRLASGNAVLHEDMSPALLRRVRDGLLASSRIRNDLKDYCRELFD